MVPQPVNQMVSNAEAARLWRQYGDTELFLAELRRRGAWKVESIKAVRELAGVDLGEAKRIVHYSRTWADARESDDAFHDAAYQALLEDGWVECELEEPVRSAH